jgi:hypothetical protein
MTTPITRDPGPAIAGCGHRRGATNLDNGAWHCYLCGAYCWDDENPAGAPALAWLKTDREFGLAADVTIEAARARPGWYCYTPDGCCWVRMAGRTWEAGDSNDAEMRLADRRRAPVRTRIDPDAVHGGQWATYLQLTSGPERTGSVLYGVSDGLWVHDRGQYKIPWGRLTGIYDGDPRYCAARPDGRVVHLLPVELAGADADGAALVVVPCAEHARSAS